MRHFAGLAAIVVIALAALAPQLARAADTNDAAQTAWRLIDYMSVDYGGAVQDGKVVSASEYAEMTEFAGQIRTRIAALPPTPAKASLVTESEAFQAAVAAKAPQAEVARLGKKLGDDLLAAYPVPLAPNRAPDLARGQQLYAQTCSGCHGATGAGDGPAAANLDPKPIAFADATRARQRSVFGLYQVIGQGVDGTPMASFAYLPSDDRWALAFYVGRFAFTDAEAAAGEKLWTSDPGLHQQFPGLQALVQTSPQALSASVGEAKARALTAYLRRNPQAVLPAASGTLAIARRQLAASVAAYEAGDAHKASELALSAYLDGFEPVEPALTARDGALMRRVEGAMGDFRAALGRSAPVDEVKNQAARLAALIDASEQALAPTKGDALSAFLGAFTILLREGLEALLIVVAMVAFLRKADRRDVLPYVHVGWIGALVAGAATWAVATFLISISGASREMTEGVGSVVAAVVLVSVGLWMHGKSHAEAWNAYVRDKLSKALSKRNAWFLFLLAFIVVYREVFETILFYAALWNADTAVAVASGAAAGAITLAVIAWALLSYSKRLPIGQFFAFSAILIAILAVVLAGKGVAALQEAGILDIHPLAGVPRIELIGLFPTVEGVIAQLVTIAVLAVGFWRSERRQRLATAAGH